MHSKLKQKQVEDEGVHRCLESEKDFQLKMILHEK